MLPRLSFLIAFFISLISICQGQHKEIDAMLERANVLRGTDLDSSIQILKAAEQLSKESNYLEGEMLSAYRAIRQGMSQANYKELDPRIRKLQEKVKGKGIDLEKYIAEFDFIKGTILMSDNTIDSAVYYFKKSISWYLDHDMKKHTSSSYVNLSKIYLKQHNYAFVKECVEKAYDAMQDESKIMKFITLTSLTRNSFAIGDYENYAKYLVEGQELSKSFGKQRNDQVSEHSLAKQVFNIEDDSLIIRLENSIPSLKKQVNKFPLIITYTTLGMAYQELGRVEKAGQYFEDRLSLEKDIEGKTLAYSYLYENRKLAKDDSQALNYLERYHALKDSVFQKDVNQSIADLQSQIKNAEKDYEIREQRKQRNVLFSALIVLSLFASYFVYTLMKRNRLNKRIFEQKNLIDKQKIIQLKKENQLTRAQALLEGQEAERTRIASDLHDGLGGLLTTVKAHYSNIKSEVVALREMQSSGRVETMIDEACGEVRRISHDLMPNVLRLDGLQTAIEDLALNMKTVHHIDVDLEILNWDEQIDKKKETFIFRIIQELSNNIVKYANANHVVLQLNRVKEEIVILIEDDGIGFDLETALKKKGLGLNSTMSRVEYLGGEIDINTEIGNGTSVTINIPIA